MKPTICIQTSICIGCNQCVEECPGDVLALVDKKAANQHPQRCISCGHCAAICPVNAITSADGNPQHPFWVSSVEAGHADMLRTLQLKRSIRNFHPKPIPTETLKQLITYAEHAPSARNTRHRKYEVITEPNLIAALEEDVASLYRLAKRLIRPWLIRLIALVSVKTAERLSGLVEGAQFRLQQFDAGQQPTFCKAPCIICISAPKRDDLARDDCVAAQHYLQLAAYSLNIDSCIIGFAQVSHKRLEKRLKLPKEQQIFAVSVLGYAQHTYHKSINYQVPDITFFE